ncbi:MAG: TIGR00153 family protein [Gemmatimonadota bacterium]
MKTVHAIAELFGRSPFGPLVHHTQKVHECVREVKPLVEAFLRGEYDEVERLYDRISDLEHEADNIKRDIRTHLPKSLYLPVNRADMLKYLKEQDAIADTAEDIAVLLTIRRTEIPVALHDEILLLTDKVIETSDLLVKAASELERLQASVFGGKGAQQVSDQIAQVNQGEYEADKVQTQLSRHLYQVEDDLDPISAYFVMKLFRLLGEIANHAENTGDSLDMMLSNQ